ncbi:MAG: pilus assembly protein [Desulfobulbus propionicus]|nr:MAG: pilus assembly protein [Desulfobulbus propionicus]
MLKKMRLNNQKGFTLIELMIVIAIIGILAAIAIPNFISYRDKAYCSAAQSDVQTVMGAIADYFADPENVTVSKASLNAQKGFTDGSGGSLSNDNTYTLTATGGTNPGYRVTVTDATNRCPNFDTVSEVL